MQLKPLPRSFHARRALQVAPELLGKLLVHDDGSGITAGRIVEVEAYCGVRDLACHASRGRTPRTEAMFGPAGHAYMFLLYGMHWAFNVVTAWEDEPHAVLVRAVEPVLGVDRMLFRRGMEQLSSNVSNGPGKLCAALGLGRTHYGQDLCSAAGVWVADDGVRVGRVGRSARINVDYAGPWAAKRWRFHVRGNPYVGAKPRD